MAFKLDSDKTLGGSAVPAASVRASLAALGCESLGGWSRVFFPFSA